MRHTFRPIMVKQREGPEPEMVVSTQALDRDDDRILAEAWDLRGFRRNPVLLWAHRSSDLPIGRVTQVGVEPGTGLRARWRWLEGDPFAERVRNAWEQGIVRAASVGFLPLDGRANPEGGHDFTRAELLEVSLVPVPANPEAVRTLKALGLAEDDFDVTLDDLHDAYGDELDDDGTIIVDDAGDAGGDLCDVSERDLAEMGRRVLRRVTEETRRRLRNLNL